jgi:hypothetical protein
MKFIKYLFIVFSFALVLPSCEDSLNINENPLAATSADPNVILPFVMVQYSNRHVTELGSRTLDVPQQFTACFNSPRLGNTSIFLTGNTWGMMYSQVLGNLLLVEQDALAAGETSNNVAAIAKILKAHTYFELSSIWEDVPFSQALDATSFPEPVFDRQEDILEGVITILDDALALIDAGGGLVDLSVGDVMYGGNMESWRKLANSLKLRTLMLMSNKKDITARANEVLSQPLITANSETAMITYPGGAGGQNGLQALVEAFFGPDNESTQVYAPTSTVFDLLEGDPRFDLMIVDPAGNGPTEYGTFAGPADAVYSNNVIREDLPHMILMPAEIDLYRAELAMRAGDAAGADAAYRAGVAKNLRWWGQDVPGVGITLDNATIDAYVASLPAPTMQDIHEQLYLESMFRPIIAWNTVRRTNVPALDAAPGAIIGTILKRYNYPPDEVASNPNTPGNAPTDTPMWFEN